jgi:serine/threonine protein phosphatase PrpC
VITVGGWITTAGPAMPLDLVVRTTEPFVVAIADGLGGHADGEVASRLAADVLNRNYRRLTTPEHVAAVVSEANVAIHSYTLANPRAAGMGSTLAGVAILGSQAVVFNVGDSSVFRIVDGYAGLLSTSDRPPTLPGQPGDAPSHLVLQCLGGTRVLEGIEPHAYQIGVEPGDRFVVCSDGLTDVVPMADLGRFGSLEPAKAMEQLLSAALEAGGPDNISIIVIEVQAVIAQSMQAAASGARETGQRADDGGPGGNSVQVSGGPAGNPHGPTSPGDQCGGGI